MAIIKGDNFSNNVDNSDPLEGTGSNDTIYGYAGNDDLFGYGGNDVLYGGSGGDDLWGGSGINNLWGGSGHDYFVMSARSSSVLSDNYIGDFQFDDDTVDLRAWGVSDFSQIKMLLKNTSDGNAYFNATYGGRNNVVEIGEVSTGQLQSSDFVYSKSGAREISGTRYIDTLFGSRSADLIEGGSGGDTLLGGYGNDRIYGDAGNDRIFGGMGQDVMSGNSGDDVFVFATASETSPNSRDRITDFDIGSDTIDLSRIDALPKFSGNQEFEWIGRDSFDAAGELRYSYSGSKTVVQGNTDSDSSSEFQIVLDGHIKLIADDFIL